MLYDDFSADSRRSRIVAHLLLCFFQLAVVSWALLVPDPLAIIRETSLDWVSSLHDMLKHAFVFTVLSATLFSFYYAVRGEIPAFVVFGVLAYSVVIEGLQFFVPGRTCDPLDAIANVAGFVLGLTIVRVGILLRSSVPVRL